MVRTPTASRRTLATTGRSLRWAVAAACLLTSACGASPVVNEEVRDFCALDDRLWNPELHSVVLFRPDWSREAMIYPEDREIHEGDYPFTPHTIEWTSTHPLEAAMMSNLMVIHDRGGLVMARGLKTPFRPDADRLPALAAVHETAVDELLVFEVVEGAQSCVLSEEIWEVASAAADFVSTRESNEFFSAPRHGGAWIGFTSRAGSLANTRRILQKIESDIDAGRCLVVRPPREGDPEVTVEVHRRSTRHRGSENALLTFDIRIDDKPLFRGQWGAGPRQSCCNSDLGGCSFSGSIITAPAAIRSFYGEE